MTTPELHVRVGYSCVACVICSFLCKKLGDFGRERERERVPGESLESILKE